MLLITKIDKKKEETGWKFGIFKVNSIKSKPKFNEFN